MLLVETSGQSRPRLEACGSTRRPVCVVHVETLSEARDYLAHQPVDLAVVHPTLIDGSGLGLAAEIGQTYRGTATVMTSGTADLDLMQQALRAGVADVLAEDLDEQQFALRIADVLKRQSRDTLIEHRLDRLHRLCRKLNDARTEVSRQVDVLCNDLVIAYQELALQMQTLVQNDEFTHLVSDELDLETLLRKTLEHLMTKLGPANAAIFLPATMDEYSLGGYVNYDCSSGTADLLLEQLGDGLVPRVADTLDLVHLTEPAEIESWVGQHTNMLENAGLVAAPCMSGEECLAVLVLFRDLDQPFEHEHLDRVSSLAPMLGDALEKIIRVHHRSVFKEYEAEGYDAADAPDVEDDELDELPF